MIEQLLAEHQGIVNRRQLLSADWSDAEIRRAVRTGGLECLRRGWYRTEGANDDVARAVALGGSLACLSALTLHGLWVPPTRDLHIRRTQHFVNKALPTGVRDCQFALTPTTRTSWPVDPLQMALTSAMRCASSETAVVLLDSALHRQLITRNELDQLFAGLPGRFGKLLARVDAKAESGTETMVRLRLRRRRIKLRTQVQIGDIGRVDLLIGDRLIVEVDSRAHHDGATAQTWDKARDRRFSSLGYIVVRVTYTEVMLGWEAVEASLLAIIRARRHLWPRTRARG